MNDMIQSGFDYAMLPVDAALNARAAAERIKLRLKRTVEDIIEIGRELTAVKADLPHGHFLPWIAAEFEMSHVTATQFMNVSERFGGQILNNLTFKPTVLYALAAPSTPETVIDKAIEKAESGEKVTVADVKDWKAEIESEKKAREIAERRSNEFSIESNDRRKKIIELESKVIELEKRKPEVITKTPDDYETIKLQCSNLVTELNRIKDQQAKLINDQVKSKLHGYQSEIDDMEKKKSVMQEQVDRMKEYMASLNSESKRLEVHQDVIEKSRLHLISLAAFLSDSDEMNDKDTRDRWLRLSNMHNDAHKAILSYLGLGDNLNQLVA